VDVQIQHLSLNRCVHPWLVQRSASEILLIFKEASLAQLVGGVDVHTQHMSSNPHGRELRFLFILKVQAGPGTHAIYLENYALILSS
jgi:hypothetical protein